MSEPGGQPTRVTPPICRSSCDSSDGVGAHGVIAVGLDGQRALRQELHRVVRGVIRAQGDLAGVAARLLPLPHDAGQRRLQIEHPGLPPH